MKSIGILFCAAALCGAAEFSTGQAARAVIGQKTFTAQEEGTSSSLLGGVSGIAYWDNMLIVADSNRVGAVPDNNRVLIFRDLNSFLPAPLASIPLTGDRCPVCKGVASTVLGQTDFDKKEKDPKAVRADTFYQPTAVATDGQRLAVADTNFNRVLIWNSIPTSNNQPADVVVGQENATSAPVRPHGFADQRSLRGPQGVWIQGNRLFVADTQNHRVLIWNSIPTQNNQPADIVLGFPDFTSNKEGLVPDPSPTSLLNPVSVTSDGVRLYVADLGHNRVLIWNSIPTSNNQPADVVIGQPDMNSSDPNNSSKLCEPTGQDEDGNNTYPPRCAATLDFPRFALSDGKRLFIADGGNDRVLVYNSIPTQNGQAADAVLGQPGDQINQISDSDPSRISAADALRTPTSLAWDGTNLYVSDPFNRRIMVFTPGERLIPNTGVRNAAGPEVFAVGTVKFGGEIKADEEVIVKIGEKEYRYKIVADDNFASVIQKLVDMINAGEGDPLVLATPNTTLNSIIFTAREAGPAGNNVSFSVTTEPAAASITTETSGANLQGGQDAAKIAPFSLVSLIGDGLAETTVVADSSSGELPRELGGVEVYFDGIRAPLLYVSPNQINAQMPVEVADAKSVSAYVRIQKSTGTIITTPIAVPIVPQNPGIFAHGGTDPRPGVVMHGSSYATGTILFTGTAKENEVATVTIEDRSYSYTIKANQTIDNVRDELVTLINQSDPQVVADGAVTFGVWLRLRARVPGKAGEGIRYGASSTEGGQITLSPTGSALCCSNIEGALVTEENPAVPGQYIKVLATGLGLVKQDEARQAMITGRAYDGPVQNEPNEFVSSLAGGKTANVISANLLPGSFGVYEVLLELNSDLPTNPRTQLTIAQSVYVSNIITFPVFNPKPPEE